MKKLPLLISIPHGGVMVPRETLFRTELTKKDIFYDGDALSRSIYNFKDKVESLVINNYARAILDMNRAPDDRPPSNEDGVVKTVRVNDKPVYRGGMYPDSKLINKLIDKYHNEYHQKISSALKKESIKFAFDCHTMFNKPPGDVDMSNTRPLVCLSNHGNNTGNSTKNSNATCSSEKIQYLSDLFKETFGNNEDIRINNPFSGGYISQYHFSQSKTPWIQIELNRKLYLPEEYLNIRTMTYNRKVISQLNKITFNILNKFSEQL